MQKLTNRFSMKRIYGLNVFFFVEIQLLGVKHTSSPHSGPNRDNLKYFGD
jgi:hypothetical protein